MQELGKIVGLIGVLLAIAGFTVWKFGSKFPVGRLPGDIIIQKPGFTFYFPVATCVLVSLILTAILWLLRKP